MAPDDIRTDAVEARPSLEGKSTNDLLLTLQAVDPVRAELMVRGGTVLRNVLSKVEGFPPDLNLRECYVYISDLSSMPPAVGRQCQLAICVRIPVRTVGAELGGVEEADRLRLELKKALERLPEVARVITGNMPRMIMDGSTQTEIGSLAVVLDPDYVSGPGEHVQADDSAAEEGPVLSSDPSEAVRRGLAAEVVASATTAAVGAGRARRELAAAVADAATAAARAGRGGVV